VSVRLDEILEAARTAWDDVDLLAPEMAPSVAVVRDRGVLVER